MLTKEQYNKMKERYGKVSSWAIWAAQGDTPKSNVGDLSIFDDEKVLLMLNTGYVFVGLNVSGTEVNTNITDWRNFHSPNPKHHDYKLRYALKGTPYWGSYITDVIKLHADTNGENVMSYMKKHPSELQRNLESFEEEIAFLGETPVLVAMGDKVYNILRDNLPKNKYKILKIKHYSFTISKENYRKELLLTLKE